MTMTTTEKCKMCLEDLRGAVNVVNLDLYEEAVSGIKSLQLELCKSFEREKATYAFLQEQLKVGDAKFFKIMIPIINEAEEIGCNHFYSVFPEDEE